MATLYRVLAPQVHGDHISGRRRITCQIAWGVNISLPPELLDTPEATGKGEVIPVARSSSSSDWHTNCKFSKEWFSLSTAVSSATDFCQIATGGIRTCLYSIQVEWQSLICLNKADSDRFLRTLSQDLEEFQDRWLKVIDHSKGGILCFADWKWL